MSNRNCFEARYTAETAYSGAAVAWHRSKKFSRLSSFCIRAIGVDAAVGTEAFCTGASGVDFVRSSRRMRFVWSGCMTWNAAHSSSSRGARLVCGLKEFVISRSSVQSGSPAPVFLSKFRDSRLPASAAFIPSSVHPSQIGDCGANDLWKMLRRSAKRRMDSSAQLVGRSHNNSGRLRAARRSGRVLRIPPFLIIRAAVDSTNCRHGGN